MRERARTHRVSSRRGAVDLVDDDARRPRPAVLPLPVAPLALALGHAERERLRVERVADAVLDDAARALVRRVDLEDLVPGLAREDVRERRLAETWRAREEEDLQGEGEARARRQRRTRREGRVSLGGRAGKADEASEAVPSLADDRKDRVPADRERDEL